MEPTDNTGEAAAASRTPERAHGGAATLAGGVASDHPLGPVGWWRSWRSGEG